MDLDRAKSPPPSKARAIVQRTCGRTHGPATRLMSPSDLGEILKPFVFLDLFDHEGAPFKGGLHPHSGIATLTYVAEGAVSYIDPANVKGTLPAGGASPYTGLIADSSGNLYGTTSNGGRAYSGVVFTLSPGGTYTVLYSFAGGSDGRLPVASLIADSSGNLYGTTIGGGASSAGVVFTLSPGGRFCTPSAVCLVAATGIVPLPA